MSEQTKHLPREVVETIKQKAVVQCRNCDAIVPLTKLIENDGSCPECDMDLEPMIIDTPWIKLKDVLAVLDDVVIIDKQKWQEILELVKNRPSLNHKRFRERWCIDTFEAQRDKYRAFINDTDDFFGVLDKTLADVEGEASNHE